MVRDGLKQIDGREVGAKLILINYIVHNGFKRLVLCCDEQSEIYCMTLFLYLTVGNLFMCNKDLNVLSEKLSVTVLV